MVSSHRIGGSSDNPGLKSELFAQVDWREVLRQHAAQAWRSDGRQPANETIKRLPQLGPMAEEAVALVDTFTLGALARAKRDGRDGGSGPPDEFFEQLSLILNSLEPSVQGCAQSAEDGSPLIFQSELWQVLRKMRESAELAYAREVDLVELDRRILFLLRCNDPLVPADISTSVGVDKAQVSRSVKHLLDLRMVEREQIRAPVILTRKGEALADRLLRLADLRNRELAFGIGEDELEQFFAATEVLLKRSITLYDRERACANLSGLDDGVPKELTRMQRHEEEAVLVNRSRIMSPLLTLSAYFSRSGALAFKRRTGLSNFEARVLNEIGKAPPIDWPTLTAALERDHSQAGRTVRALMDRGLLVREGRPGRRHGTFSPTQEGRKVYDLIQKTSVERSTFLMAPLGDEVRTRFLATFDKVRRNAVAQLARERALEELDRV